MDETIRGELFQTAVKEIGFEGNGQISLWLVNGKVLEAIGKDN